MKSANRLIVCLLFALFFSGCAKGRQSTPQEKAPLLEQAAPATVASNVPVKLNVAQEFVENGELHVKLLVEPLVAMKSSQIVLRLKGLKDGNVVEKQEQFLSESALKEIISPGERYSLRFQLNADGLSEYQIECSWGNEAQQPKARLAPETQVDLLPPGVSLADVVLESTEVECEQPPCDRSFVLTGELRNGDDTEIGSVVLALGVFWAESGSGEPPFPPPLAELDLNEEKVALTGLRVPSKGAKKVRVKLDRALPQLDTGGFVPHLRLLSYSREPK